MKRRTTTFSFAPAARYPSKQPLAPKSLSRQPAIRNPSRLIIASTLLLAIAACSDKDNTPTDNTSTIIDPAVSGPAPTMPAPGSNPDDLIQVEGLAGVWRQDCLANDSTQTPYYSSTLSISNDTGTQVVSHYADNACIEMLSNTTSELSFLFSGMQSATSLGDAYHVEMTDEQTNDSQHDLLLIVNNSLYFGDQGNGLDGSTEALRPVQLDQVYFYVRESGL